MAQPLTTARSDTECLLPQAAARYSVSPSRGLTATTGAVPRACRHSHRQFPHGEPGHHRDTAHQELGMKHWGPLVSFGQSEPLRAKFQCLSPWRNDSQESAFAFRCHTPDRLTEAVGRHSLGTAPNLVGLHERGRHPKRFHQALRSRCSTEPGARSPGVRSWMR